jgi:hypothetical protein
MRDLSVIFFYYLLGIASSGKSTFAVFICLLALTFVYRIQFTLGLFTNPISPFDFIPAPHPIGPALAYLPSDFALVLG